MKRGQWVLGIHLSNLKILNALILIIPKTLNVNELWKVR